MVRQVRTSSRQRIIVALAAVGVLAVPPAAEGATFWTIRPDVRDPLLWVGLSPVDQEGTGSSHPILAAPTAGALDQHWSLRRSADGYTIVNRQSGQCLRMTPVRTYGQVEAFMGSCTPAPRQSESATFHRPGGQPVRTVNSGGVYQIRFSWRRRGEEVLGRCLSVGPPGFYPGALLGHFPCALKRNQRFLVRSFSAP